MITVIRLTKNKNKTIIFQANDVIEVKSGDKTET